MFDMVKSGLLAGLGAVVLTRDKIDQTLERFVDQGRLSREEAARLAEELQAAGRGEWERLRQGLQEAWAKARESLDPAGRKRLAELEARVENLEKRLSLAEDRLGPGQ